MSIDFEIFMLVVTSWKEYKSVGASYDPPKSRSSGI